MKQNNGLCIIVVEDNLLYQQLIAKQLETISYKIHFFTNGEDFLEEFVACKADIIVLDNNLSGDISGLDTLKLIRAIDATIHVILFSTEPGLDTEENLLFYGPFQYVEKNKTGFKILKDKILKSDVYKLSSKCNV